MYSSLCRRAFDLPLARPPQRRRLGGKNNNNNESNERECFRLKSFSVFTNFFPISLSAVATERRSRAVRGSEERPGLAAEGTDFKRLAVGENDFGPRSKER